MMTLLIAIGWVMGFVACGWLIVWLWRVADLYLRPTVWSLSVCAPLFSLLGWGGYACLTMAIQTLGGR